MPDNPPYRCPGCGLPVRPSDADTIGQGGGTYWHGPCWGAAQARSNRLCPGCDQVITEHARVTVTPAGPFAGRRWHEDCVELAAERLAAVIDQATSTPDPSGFGGYGHPDAAPSGEYVIEPGRPVPELEPPAGQAAPRHLTGFDRALLDELTPRRNAALDRALGHDQLARPIEGGICPGCDRPIGPDDVAIRPRPGPHWHATCHTSTRIEPHPAGLVPANVARQLRQEHLADLRDQAIQAIAANLAPSTAGHRFHLAHRMDPTTRGRYLRWECSCSTPVDTGRPDAGPTPAGPWHPAIAVTDPFDTIVAEYLHNHLAPLLATTITNLTP